MKGRRMKFKDERVEVKVKDERVKGGEWSLKMKGWRMKFKDGRVEDEV